MNIQLTARQKQICEFLLMGVDYVTMAEEMGIEHGSVKNLAKQLLDLSGMGDHVELALWLHAHRKELGIECPCSHGYNDGALLVMA